jgi:translation initiation factor eIF-2B subunit alpha/methylthioribose-1-phosphate isomerase
MRVTTERGAVEMRSVRFTEDCAIDLIDQRKLPWYLSTFRCYDSCDVAFAIKEMVVRGAPAIGATAAYGLAQAWVNGEDLDETETKFRSTRPTARDLFHAIDYTKGRGDLVKTARDYVESLVEECKRIGAHGNRIIDDGDRVLTHCNAGALATVDWGTALAPLRFAKRRGKGVFVWVDETRPRMQGGLTSWELKNEGIDHRVVVDNASGYLMQKGEVELVIVGADRVTRNGDVVNKVGTYEKALSARENGVPFYVAFPSSTLDTELESGDQVEIEERSQDEIKEVGLEDLKMPLYPGYVRAENPAFDVTPHDLITGYIMGEGVKRRI